MDHSRVGARTAFLASIKSRKWRTKLHINYINSGLMTVVNSCQDWNYIRGFVLIRERPSVHVHLNAACHCLRNVRLRCSTHIFRWTVFDLLPRWWGRGTHLREVALAWFGFESLLEHFQQKAASLWGSGKPWRLIHHTCKPLTTQAKQELRTVNAAALHSRKKPPNTANRHMSSFYSDKTWHLDYPKPS